MIANWEILSRQAAYPQEFRNWGRAQEKEAGIEWSCELEGAETVRMDIRNAFLELAGVRIR